MPKWTEPWKVIQTCEYKSIVVNLQPCIDSHLIRDVPLTQVPLISQDLVDHLSTAVALERSADLRKDIIRVDVPTNQRNLKKSIPIKLDTSRIAHSSNLQRQWRDDENHIDLEELLQAKNNTEKEKSESVDLRIGP